MTIVLLDSYTSGTQVFSLHGSGIRYTSQSFSNVNQRILDSVTFKIYKLGSPTGNFYVSVYKHTGTYGVSSKPTGVPIATQAYDISQLTTTATELNIQFDGSNRVILQANTKYVASIHYLGGGSSNCLRLTVDGFVANHSGNTAYSSDGSLWTTLADYDTYFKVYGDDTPLVWSPSKSILTTNASKSTLVTKDVDTSELTTKENDDVTMTTKVEKVVVI